VGPHDPFPLLGSIAGHPERSEPPSVADVMARYAVRDAPAVSLLERRLAFEKRHPEVTITPSGHTRSGLWEADWPGRGRDELARHDTCAGLIDYLEARFDREDPASSGQP
jgi:hypothetical protein